MSRIDQNRRETSQQPQEQGARCHLSRRLSRAAVFFASCVLLFQAGAEPTTPRLAPPLELNEEKVTWQELSYRARKLTVTARTRVRLERLSSDEARKQLAHFPERDTLEPSGEFTVRVELDSSFLGRRSLTELWCDPDSAAVFQQTRLETGKRQRRRLYRFEHGGVFSRRVTPAEGEKGQAPTTWSDVSEQHFGYGGAKLPIVSEPSALFYLLSAMSRDALDKGVQFIAFTDKRPHRLSLRSTGTKELTVNYQRGGEQVTGRVDAIRLQLGAASLDGQPGEIELLGLEGDIELLLDPETHIPLQISGKIPPVGRVNVKLESVKRR